MKKKLFLGFLVSFFLLGLTGIANAVIININSRSNHESNPVSVFLSAGTYEVTPIGISNGGSYNAWNAWGGQVSGCDSNGENCYPGWVNHYYFSSSEFAEIMITSGIRYANPTLALYNAIDTSFTISTDTSVDFYVRDGVNGSSAGDNVGGMSLNIMTICPFAVEHLETGYTYMSLQDAYDDPVVQSSDTLLINTNELYENITFDRDIVVTLEGGYYCDFFTRDGVSIVHGDMVIRSGTVIIDNIILI